MRSDYYRWDAERKQYLPISNYELEHALIAKLLQARSAIGVASSALKVAGLDAKAQADLAQFLDGVLKATER
jgi:hypothetical protein